MKLVIGETKVKHKKFGEGILIDKDGDVICIEFSDCMKKFDISKISDQHMTIIENSYVKQDLPINDINSHSLNNALDKSYGLQVFHIDSTNSISKERNIIEGNDLFGKVFFNESYVVIGDMKNLTEVYSCYDLTIIGSIEAELLNVNGKLIVSNDIRCNKIVCNSSLICDGLIKCAEITIGGSSIIEAIESKITTSNGDVLIKSTGFLNQKTEIDGSIVSCEGLIGNGSIKSKNIITFEYFDFAGEVDANVIDLSINQNEKKNECLLDNDSKTNNSNHHIFEFEGEINKYTEEEIIYKLTECVKTTYNSRAKEILKYFKKMIKYSYENSIDNIIDYLEILLARKKLPLTYQNYETIEGVFSILLNNAEKRITELQFKPKSFHEIANAIKLVELCKVDLGSNYEIVMDCIFSSIGLRYNFVNKIISGGISNE